MPFDPTGYQAVRAYARQVLVSVLATSTADVEHYRARSGTAPLAMYAPEDADPALFHAAHRRGAVVISDAISDKPKGSLEQRGARR